jgi:hypothetical protein
MLAGNLPSLTASDGLKVERKPLNLMAIFTLLVMAHGLRYGVNQSEKTERLEGNMKSILLAAALLIGITQSGCAFLGGAALGTLATGAGYEINAKSQMDKLEDDYRRERISRSEYENRKAQIEKGSIVY